MKFIISVEKLLFPNYAFTLTNIPKHLHRQQEEAAIGMRQDSRASVQRWRRGSLQYAVGWARHNKTEGGGTGPVKGGSRLKTKRLYLFLILEPFFLAKEMKLRRKSETKSVLGTPRRDQRLSAIESKLH